MKNVIDHPLKTGHLTFDRQANQSGYIGSGNVMSNVQLSSHIRSATTRKCNGYEFAQKFLRETDLKTFSNLPNQVLAKVLDLTENSSCYLYEFRHWYRDKYGLTKKRVHGYIISDENHRFLWDFFVGPPAKSLAVLKKVRRYVTE